MLLIPRHKQSNWIRGTTTIITSAMIICLLHACVFGPEVHGIVHVDHSPYIDPQDTVPNTENNPSVIFDLAETDRTQQFQLLGVYDWDERETLTYAFVLRIGSGDQISIPPATTSRPSLNVSSVQPIPYATRYQSSQLNFDPCTYRDVLEGRAKYGTLQIVVYDENNSVPSYEDDWDQYITRWTWLLEFHGQCPLCADDNQCFDNEICVEGLCIAQ